MFYFRWIAFGANVGKVLYLLKTLLQFWTQIYLNKLTWKNPLRPAIRFVAHILQWSVEERDRYESPFQEKVGLWLFFLEFIFITENWNPWRNINNAIDSWEDLFSLKHTWHFFFGVTLKFPGGILCKVGFLSLEVLVKVSARKLNQMNEDIDLIFSNKLTLAIVRILNELWSTLLGCNYIGGTLNE